LKALVGYLNLAGLTDVAQHLHLDDWPRRLDAGAELINAELFGHEKGSFTGAIGARRGWFERADGGTLCLDEIGELPPAAQVRLLRVLQEGTFERVGSERALKVGVRIVAATHRDLAAMVQSGLFREDLWYRVGVFPIVLPPLREHPEDIPALVQHFAHRAATRFGFLPLSRLSTASECCARLVALLHHLLSRAPSYRSAAWH
jgi:transcriptional regulator with GAF, ATPase, and Fis domain